MGDVYVRGMWQRVAIVLGGYLYIGERHVCSMCLYMLVNECAPYVYVFMSV